MNNKKIDRQLNTDELTQVTGGDEISAESLKGITEICDMFGVTPTNIKLIEEERFDT